MKDSYNLNRKLLSSLIAACIATSSYAQTPDAEEIIVTGIRASQQAAVDVKRKSEGIVDSIVSEDIGKLPDVSITDSLQRITGVQIDRTAGEGSSLNVRGMPQVLTTLNGEQFLSPWSITDIKANYGDVPSAMISAVDVHKSQSASMLAGGISGLIDLKTHRPLEMKNGWTASAGIEGSEGSITKDPNNEANAFVGYNSGEFGFTLAGFHSTTNAANYRIWQDSRLGFVNSGGDPLDLNNDGNKTTDRYLVPGGYGVNAYVMEREREGLATSFQAQINDKLTFTADVFYTKMDQFDRGVETQFNGSHDSNYDVLRPGTVTHKEAVLPASGSTPSRTINSIQVAVVEAPDFQATTASEQNHTKAINSNFQLDYDSGDAFKGTLRFVHATADKSYEKAVFQQGTPAWYWIDNDHDDKNDPRDPFLVTVDYTKKYPSFSYTDDLSSPDRLNMFQAFGSGTEETAELNVFRADGKYAVEIAGFTSFDAGLRYGSREATHKNFDYATPTGYYSTWNDTSVPENLRFQPLPGDYIWQRYPDWNDFKGNADLKIPAFDALKAKLISYNDFGPFKGFEKGVAALDPKSLDNVNAFMNFLYPGAKRFEDPTRAYKVTENSTSAYLQGNFENTEGIFNIPFTGNIGVQVIETDREVIKADYVAASILPAGSYYGGGAQAALGQPPAGWQALLKTTGHKTYNSSFTDVLPAANINFRPADDVIVRFGYNQTMTRNDLRNVGEGLTLWYQEYKVYTPNGTKSDENGKYNVVTSPGGGNEMGNPNVKPWRADNYNISTEWYFDQGSILGIALFMIDVKTATEDGQEARSFPDSDGVVRRTANIWSTKNVSASDLKGIEFGYKQPFTFLPGFLSNTGAEFNFTYSDSVSTAKDLEGNHFPLQSNSKYQYNAVLWYQADKLSARVAYNWRSAIYQGQVGLNTNEASISLGNWTEPSGYLDASINYDVLDNVTVYLQGTNLTETNQRNYAQFKDAFQSLNVQEKRVAVGLRVKM